MPFDIATLCRPDLPPPAIRWKGFPRHNFVGGHVAPEAITVADLVAAASRVIEREGATLAMYGLHSGPQGYRPLREFLAGRLARYAGMSCTADDIVMTSGSLQAIDLVNQVLLAPGDTVVIEQANYAGCLTRFNKAGVTAVPVAIDEHGMRMDALAATLEKLAGQGVRPKYIYTIPTVQNPTGSILPLDRRQEMLRLAAKYDTAIFEDECYSDLVWSGTRPPAIHSLDKHGRVVFCSTFSKSIAPALRVGYLVASWPFLSRALACKNDAGSGALEQMVLAEYAPDHFDEHVASLNKLLEAKLDILMQSLDENFGTSAEFSKPPGGIYLWVRLAEPVDTTRLAQVAAAAGVAVNPGVEWTKDQADGNRHIRICFASCTADEIRGGIARLAEICHETFGVPVRSANVTR